MLGASLLCSSGGRKPCGTCKNCLLAENGEHPDLIIIEPGNPLAQGIKKDRQTIPVEDIREMIRLLRNATNNLNQVAKRANAGGGIYGADIADMQIKQDEIWETAKEILARLAAIR